MRPPGRCGDYCFDNVIGPLFVIVPNSPIDVMSIFRSMIRLPGVIGTWICPTCEWSNETQCLAVLMTLSPDGAGTSDLPLFVYCASDKIGPLNGAVHL
jgi:hypothetical protein